MSADAELGERLPKILTPLPGPESRRLAGRIAAVEAPVVNTLYRGNASIVWREARGSNVVDVDGNIFIDLTAGFGVAAIGHQHPAVVAAVRDQSERLLHGLADVASHPQRVELAGALCDLAPIADPRVHFAVSGADAVEVALKTAWLATGRRGTIAFDPAYHGTTMGALAATSRGEFRQPFHEQLNPHMTRLPYGVTRELLEAALADGDIAAVIVEPIVGREGVEMPPAHWLADLAAACGEHSALLVVDEVLTGFGRTGDWFVSQAAGIEPDLLVCGKALGGGLPIAAVLGRAELMDAWDRDGEALHTATFLANPLSCAAALATLRILERDRLPERARDLGERINAFAADWRPLPAVRAVTGRGLLWSVELERTSDATALRQAALDRGLFLLAAGPRLHLTPPLVISDSQLTHTLDVLTDLLNGHI